MTSADPASLLDEARIRAAARADELATSLAAIVESSRDANLDDEHDPEGATVGFERAQVSALLDAANSLVSEIDAARVRLDQGVYGICERCRAPIAAARFAAQPAARVCVTCAR